MASQQKPYAVGGVGAQPGLEDVLRIALGQPVVLDPAASDAVKKLSPAPKAFVPAPAPAGPCYDGNSPEALSPVHARTVLATKLMQIMNGRSGVRLAVAEYLAVLLNSGVIPQLPSAEFDATVLSTLAEACYGLGMAQQVEDPSTAASATAGPETLSSMLQKATVEPPSQGLSAAERVVLEGGAAATAGIAAITVQAGKRLLSLATATTALSFEATGAQVKSFEADAMEAQGSKAAAAVADEMRGLLEGSKRVGTLKGSGEDLPQALTQAPQRLGALSEALASAYSAVRAEVQAEALPPKGSSSGNVPSPWLATTLAALARALLSLAADAVARAERVVAAAAAASSVAADLMAPLSADVSARIASAQTALQALAARMFADVAAVPGVQASLAASSALGAAQRAVALEALAAAVALRQLEGPPQPAAPAAAAGENGAPQGVEGGDKKGGDKKGDKRDKKGGAQAVVLGKGTALMRAHVEKAAAGAAGVLALAAPADGAAAPCGAAASSGVCSALDPLSSAAAKFLDELKAIVEANQARRKPKIAKGTRDFLPEQMAIREKAFATITSVFKRHGAVAIDTPVFELRETLMGKYGEDSKLIYDLADQGGEALSLRYDLTVPFARYVALNGIGNIKRYHIGKVYRRDQPAMNRGRFREFFQCDYDVAGTYATMVADSEVLKVLVEILSDLRLGEFEVKLNHRKLLDAMLQIAGVPPQKFRTICSAIDKLDKEPWSAVRSEMVDEKGLPEEVADKIGEFVVLRGNPLDLLPVLSAPDHPLSQHPDSKVALEELKVMCDFLQAMGALSPIVLDLSLARGLDYYTGVIYEAVLKGASVGSIAAGGRYDKLVGMFSGKDVPAVGVSIGIERVFAIMEAQVRERAAAEGKPVRAVDTSVLVASIGNGLQVRRMELAARLWSAGISAEFGFKPNPKMGDQLSAALEGGVPYMVLFGEDELTRGVVKVKDMDAKTEEVVAVDELVAVIKAKLAAREAAAAPAAEAAPEAAPEAGAQ